MTVATPFEDNWSANQKKMSPKRGMAPIRRDQIVRATIHCLARDGYVGLTMKRVAAEAALCQHSPRMASFWGIAPATCQDLERCLRLHPDTAVLHYFMTEERVLIFVTTVDGTRTTYVNAPRKSLHRDVKRYRELIALQGRGGLTSPLAPSHPEALLRELAQRLYELLIAPVENRFTISDAGSTSASGTGAFAGFSSKRPRSVR